MTVIGRHSAWFCLVVLSGWLAISTGASAQTNVTVTPTNTGPNITPAVNGPSADTSSMQSPKNGSSEDYTLGSGDKIRVIVFGEDDLGGEFIVNDTGLVQLPLLGQIQASGLTIRQFEEGIGARLLKAGYLTDPHVSVEVQSYRPFYILGEVNKPGEYPYVAGMNLLNAVALAGGYTYRANESVVYIRRKGASQEEKDPADETTKINPGDILRIPERFF